MTIDLDAAADFLATHARLLDRRRFDLLFRGGDARGVLSALDGYRNPDGGYAWGLEPDLRVAISQPIGALHAFEVLEECGTAAGDRGAELCDWLLSVTKADGGLPFVTPIPDTIGCAPWFTGADPTTSSLHGTCAVVASAHRAARHDPAVAGHPWLAAATEYCLREIASHEPPVPAYELMFALQVLDAVAESSAAAAAQLARLALLIPPTGGLPVEGGLEDERLHPLDISPAPARPLRDHLDPAVVAADLDRLAGRQQEDGGWIVDFASWSPAAALEWRGYTTVRALSVLRAHGRVT